MADAGRGALYGEIRKAGQELASALQKNTEVLTGTLPDITAESGTPILITAEISRESKSLGGKIQRGTEAISGTLPGKLVFYAAGDLPPYDGPYEVTPSRQEQTLPTTGKYLAEDIKVGKIPENYGLITYNQDRIITIT